MHLYSHILGSNSQNAKAEDRVTEQPGFSSPAPSLPNPRLFPSRFQPPLPAPHKLLKKFLFS